MRILVTGGAGFIGSHLCEYLVRDGHVVTILDDLNDFYAPAQKRENLDTIRMAGPVSFYEGDICSVRTVDRVMRERCPEAVIHLAARAGVRPSLELPLLYERVNVHGALVLLEATRKASIRKFIFGSSSSIYGMANRVPFSEEDHVNMPVSPYAATKIAGEKLCYTYSHLYGIQAVCLRFFTVYGPRQRPDLAIHKFTRLILERRPIPMFGDGSSGRDYTFVLDIVQGIAAALRYAGGHQVFNLGNSRPVPLRELIEAVEKVTGLQARIDPLPDQPGDVPITYADISRAQECLGYRPCTGFLKGLERFVEWYRDVRSARVALRRGRTSAVGAAEP